MASKMDFKRSNKYFFFAGFNVWSSVNSSQRITGGVSRKLEFKLVEDAKDSSLALQAASSIALLLTILAL